MAERLAALGLRAPSKPAESIQQRQDREKQEREAKLRRAEEEDAKREQERQQRINDEFGVPQGSKKPAPPAPRKRGGSIEKHEPVQAPIEVDHGSNTNTEQGLRDQQQAQKAETKQLE